MKIEKYKSVYKESNVENLLKNFIKEQSIDFKDPNKTKGECDSIANDLYIKLKKEGIEDVSIIEGVGLKNGLDVNYADGWEEFKDEPQYLGHVVVKVKNKIIDLTGSQFGEKYNKIIYPYSEFKKIWKKVKDGPYWKEAKAIRDK